MWCNHFHRDSKIIRVSDAWPQVYVRPGLYEVIPVGKCLARGMRNVRSIPQCAVPPGRGGCRKFEPAKELAFEYNPPARLWLRYLGPLGDPEAEAEAARLEKKIKNRGEKMDKKEGLCLGYIQVERHGDMKPDETECVECGQDCVRGIFFAVMSDGSLFGPLCDLCAERTD